MELRSRYTGAPSEITVPHGNGKHPLEVAEFFKSEYGQTPFAQIFKELLAGQTWGKDFIITDSSWKPGEERLEIFHPKLTDAVMILSEETRSIEDVEEKIKNEIRAQRQETEKKIASLRAGIEAGDALIANMHHNKRIGLIHRRSGWEEPGIQPISNLAGSYHGGSIANKAGWDVYCVLREEDEFDYEHLVVYYVHLKTERIWITSGPVEKIIAGFQRMEQTGSLKAFYRLLRKAAPL